MEKFDTVEDRELVEGARSGNLEAAGTLLSRYQDVAYTVALRLMGQPADAQDIAQEALLKAYTRIADLERSENFSAWIRRITVNLCLNHLRRRGLLRFESLDGDTGADAKPPREFAARADLQPERVVLDRERSSELDEMLLTLPAEQRVAVVLRDMYDYDVSDIATMQRCGISAAKMRIVRGRSALRTLVVARRNEKKEDR